MKPIQKRISNFFKRIAYHIRGGYKCVGCNNVTRFYNPIISGKVNGINMILVNHHYLNLCPACLLSRIKKTFAESDRVDHRRCDFYKVEANTVSKILEPAHDLNVKVGVNSWNFCNASEHAFETLLCSSGICYIPRSVMHNGIAKYIDRIGIIAPSQPVIEFVQINKLLNFNEWV
ncbi:hypothetical protein UFOVP116_310 [uncultured Caudovirales phage]|uniref:Uncharacterized protein n=1 Tax=uncultured Caudovirales phage TaxID=2100421 RepID=A0A6J5L701_9CAUD|nr:hypothetical protein UFOVP116_310 [uncultured Caudovirales phage]